MIVFYIGLIGPSSRPNTHE